MIWIEVLVEGASDVPAVREVLQRKFGLREGEHFRMHPHRGKGTLPLNPLARPEPRRQGLLDQLPAKLQGFGKSLLPGSLVLVVLDVDDQPCAELLRSLNEMLETLPVKPDVLFRLAIEETESWFIADFNALQYAFPGQVKRAALRGIQADQIVGAWEKLATALGIEPNQVSPATKFAWSTRISPYLNLDDPPSPSLKRLISGLIRVLPDGPPSS